MFLMSEVPLYGRTQHVSLKKASAVARRGAGEGQGWRGGSGFQKSASSMQTPFVKRIGYLTYKKTHPPRTLP